MSERGPAKRTPWYLAGRRWVQIVSLLAVNASFFYQARYICFPVLNCWACPIAAVACPLGALQTAIVDMRALLILPLYILGSMLAVSAVFGRMMCGWLCPFGLMQEWLGKVNPRQRYLPPVAAYGKYLALVALALIAPYFLGYPLFCKLCPQGFLEGGIPQPLLHPELRALIGGWWYAKLAILAGTAVAVVFYKRAFCHAVCPLGAIFSLVNRISLVRMHYDRDACTDCMWCVRQCPQGIDPRSQLGSHACVLCMRCAGCPFGAIGVSTAFSRPQACACDAGGRADEGGCS